MTSPAQQTSWYSDESATFGDRLSDAREAVGIGQKELAERLGVKVKTVQAWENDVAEPRANKLQMLAGLLNVSIRWLLTGEGAGLTPPAETDLPPDIQALMTELRDVKTQLARSVERVAVIEKRLRTAYAEELE